VYLKDIILNVRTLYRVWLREKKKTKGKKNKLMKKIKDKIIVFLK